MALTFRGTSIRSVVLNRALAPVVAVGATVIVSGLGIDGLATGVHALHSALASAGSAHDLETIADGIQNINGNLYHVMTRRGAHIKGFNTAEELRPLLRDCDQVIGLLRSWRDTRATPEQKPRVDALITSLLVYRGAVDFVTQMLDVDFAAAVSFIEPFDKNFHDLTQSVNFLVHDVQITERADADGALAMQATTVRAFEGVVAACMVLALLAAGDILRAAIRSNGISRQNTQLARLAQMDALTGLGNRRCFDETLTAAWAGCTARQAPLTLVIFDIDHFKKYNDSQGHPAGDACLRRVGSVISGCTRDANDLAARYGGEEFAIIMPGAPLQAGLRVAERLRHAIADCAIPHPAAGPPGMVTVSIGVASVTPTATGNPIDLVDAADRGLYRAKRGGRNRVSAGSFAPEVHQMHQALGF